MPLTNEKLCQTQGDWVGQNWWRWFDIKLHCNLLLSHCGVEVLIVLLKVLLPVEVFLLVFDYKSFFQRPTLLHTSSPLRNSM